MMATPKWEPQTGIEMLKLVLLAESNMMVMKNQKHWETMMI